MSKILWYSPYLNKIDETYWRDIFQDVKFFDTYWHRLVGVNRHRARTWKSDSASLANSLGDGCSFIHQLLHLCLTKTISPLISSCLIAELSSLSCSFFSRTISELKYQKLDHQILYEVCSFNSILKCSAFNHISLIIRRVSQIANVFQYSNFFSFFVYWKQSSRSRVAGVNRTLYHQAFSLKKAKCSFWDKSFSETLFDASCLVSGPAWILLFYPYRACILSYHSVFTAQKQNRDEHWQKLTKRHLSSSSLRAMILSMASSTLSCDQVKHINLHFLFLKVSKIIFILRFGKNWKKNWLLFFQRFNRG